MHVKIRMTKLFLSQNNRLKIGNAKIAHRVLNFDRYRF